MNAFPSLLAVLAIAAAAWLGSLAAPLRPVLGVFLPELAILVFLAGVATRVIRWAWTPVPFRIPTTCGQQRSLPWIKASWLEAPWTRAGVVARMALEVLLFRSLFRNTQAALTREPIAGGHDEPAPATPGFARLVYGEQKWLWLAAIAFHWSFLLVLVRHLRFFTDTPPAVVTALASADSFFQIGVPPLYATDVAIVAGLGYLLARRLADARVRYLSLFQDYFVLYLLLGLALSGILMRYFVRPDVVAIKQLAIGLITFSPQVPAMVEPLLFVHLAMLSALLVVFPFSKLVHMAGVFLSPTRNLANTSRMRRHVNPWNPTVKVHTYEEWEDEFRDKLKAAGLPLEKA